MIEANDKWKHTMIWALSGVLHCIYKFIILGWKLSPVVFRTVFQS